MESRSVKQSLQLQLPHSPLSTETDDKGGPVIIGAMVLDIHAIPSLSAAPRTTTPGRIFYALGGVARNVAECVSKLDVKPFIISALGFDMAGNLLLEDWKSSRLSLEGIKRHKDIETAVVCNVFDGSGELAAGVASVESIEKFLTAEWIGQFKHHICSAPILMVDANLSPSALEASCQIAAECNVPVWFEPVSVTKSKRIASVVKYVTFTSPNEDELIAMANALSCGDVFHQLQKDGSGVMLSTESLFRMLRPAILVLLEKGIKVVIVTLGSDGIFLCSKGGCSSFEKIDCKKHKPDALSYQLYEIVNSTFPPNQFPTSVKLGGSSNLFAMHIPALPASVVRLAGAGDCFVGGTLASMCAGLDVLQSMSVGVAAAKAAVEAETNVPAAYSLAKIADEARSVYIDSKVVFCQSML